MTDRPSLEQLVAARNAAMDKVRAWWDAELLAGRIRNQTEAPAWSEYLAAFAALDEAREALSKSGRLADWLGGMK